MTSKHADTRIFKSCLHAEQPVLGRFLDSAHKARLPSQPSYFTPSLANPPAALTCCVRVLLPVTVTWPRACSIL